jgi:hypothetical protein
VKLADISGTKKRKYLKDEINKLETNNKNNNNVDLYRGINELKKGYQPRSNLVKDKDSHNILNRWKNYFSHYLPNINFNIIVPPIS